MTRTTLLSAILLFSICTSLLAQNIEFKKSNFPDQSSEFKKAISAKKNADYFFEGGIQEYNYAIPEYLIAYNFNPKNAKLNYRLGVCYLYSIYKTRAEKYLKEAYDINPQIENDIYYMLGRAFHINEKWSEAIEFYNKHLKRANSETEKEDILRKIKECNNGLEFSSKPLNVVLSNVGDGVNTIFPEYLVIINADESIMMFTSQRPGTTGETSEEAHDDFIFHNEDIYVSTMTENSSWGNTKNIGRPVNTNLNDATIALAPDGHTVLTYNDKSGGGDIYECKLNGDKWSQPHRLSSHVNSQYHESSASFSYDGKSLFFVSNRPEDNYGDHDIYMSHWDDSLNQWGKATNLGENINTPYSEQGVFAHPDGHALYFSSKGHNTMGGFDIFKSEWNEETGTWGKPKNIGYPINGADNDVGFVMAASGRHGYLSAYHSDSRGKADIYRIDFPEGEIEHLTLLKGHTYDNKTKKPVQAKIEIIDLGKHEIVATFESNSLTGHYLVSLPAGKNYAIEIESEGYLFHSENFNLPKTDGYHEVKKDIYLDQIEVGQKMVLNNIFFDYNKASLRTASEDELQIVINFMQENSSLKIEISGHTDNRGSHDYNQQLSENRAHAVVDYLVAHGIKKERLVFKGYGEEEPIAKNDTEENMQLNRRTELKIIGK